MKLVIEKKAFELKFGFKCFMILGRKLGLDTFGQVVDKFQGFGNTADISFDQMELLELLVESAVETHPDYHKLDYTIADVSVIDFLMANQDQLSKVMEAFADSFPKDQGKPKAQRKTRKKTA